VSWLSLTKATTLLDHDAQRARESLGRAISKAWIVGPGGSPAPAIDPNVPLRVQVTPSPGRRLVGRDWLEPPVLYFERLSARPGCLRGHLSQRHPPNREDGSRSGGRTLAVYGVPQKFRWQRSDH